MKITTKLNINDYLYFCKFDTIQKIRNYIIPIYILVLLNNRELFYNQWWLTDLERFWIITWFILKNIIVIVLLYTLFKLYIRYIYKKDSKNKQLISGEKELIFNNENIIIHWELYETQLKWNIFNKIIETKQQILLYTGENSTYVIPKYSLNKKEIQSLIDILEKKCKEFNLKFQRNI